MGAPMEFQNRVVLVTGTTGIGRAVAKRLAGAGASVLSCGNDATRNEKLQQEASRERLSIETRMVDVFQAGDVQSAVGEAASKYGGLDIIVNCAAIHPYGDCVETDLETWNRCISVNVGGIYLFAHYGIPEIKKRGGGAIVNLASVQGRACQRGVAAYATSKGAIQSLTRALALDHARDHIRVNSISPGSIATPILELSARMLGARPFRRRGFPPIRQRSSARPNRHARGGCGAGGISGFGPIEFLYRRRLSDRWRVARQARR